MARGPKRHLKRLAAPRHWMLNKMGGKYATRPSTGRHKLRECMPLTVILRNRLKYALTRDEVMRICMQKLIQVDGKVRTDTRFPCGFMDVITIPKSGDTFRMLYNTKGRFVLHRIDAKEAQFKLCRVVRQEQTKKGIPTITTHDGRTVRYPDPHARVLDTVKIDIATGKTTAVFKFELGAVVMITGGRNSGRVGVLTHRDRHPGSFDIVHVRDRKGNTFATRLDNAFIIGKGADAAIELPHGDGIKKFLLD